MVTSLAEVLAVFLYIVGMGVLVGGFFWLIGRCSK